jgi:Peptidase family C25/Propeptide_C25
MHSEPSHTGRADTRCPTALAFLLLAVASSLSPQDAEAQLRTKVGSLIAPTANGTQSITGVGFQPKAIIFFWTGQTATGFASDATIGYGVTTSPTSAVAMAYTSRDNLASASNNPQRWLVTASRCVLVTDNTGGGVAYGVLSTMDADGFTLNWTRTGTAWIVHYMALGGPDITAATIGNFTPTAGTGSQSVTGVGFQPDFLMFLTIDSASATPVNDGKVSLGYAGRSSAYGITQGGVTAATLKGSGNVITSAAQRTDAAIVEKDTVVTTMTFQGAVTSFDADGFTISKAVNTAGTETPAHFLALRGGQYRVGAITRPTTNAPPSLPASYTGVGFVPRGLIFSSYNLVAQSTGDEDARISFSAADARFSGAPYRPNQRATFFHDKIDNPSDADNTWVRQGTSGSAAANGKVVFLAQAGDCPLKFPQGTHPFQCQDGSGPRLITDADVARYDADGFTLNWTTNDRANANQIPGDEENAQILYVAFGDTPASERMYTKVDSFTAGTTTVNVGFKPAAVIFFWTTQTANGFAVNASAGFGFATGAGSERAAIFVSDHDLVPASHNSGNWQWTNRCIGVVLNAAEPSTPDAEAQLTAMTTTGFTLTWVNPPSQPWIIHYMALGGRDITNATVGSFTPAANAVPNVAEPESFAGVGFQPDFLMFLAINSTTTPTRASPDGKLTLGWAAGPNGSITQGSHAVCSRTTGAQINAAGAQSHYDAIVEAVPGGGDPGLAFVAAVTSFDANGFTISKKHNYSPYTPVHYLALRGGRYKVGEIFRPTVTAPPSLPQSVSGVGFTPHGLVLSSWGEIQSVTDPIKDESSRMNFSAVDDEFSARAIFFHEVSENGNDGDRSWVKQGTWGNVSSSSKALYLAQAGKCQSFFVPPDPPPGAGGPMCYPPPVGEGMVITDADLASYNADGFTINWTTNDLANMNGQLDDERQAEVFYVAFGPSSTTEVELSSFTAQGGDSSVSLEWQTASELDNLGFHLYRTSSEAGPYERITSSLIPGLGSSPVGGRYSYADAGLTNGVRYYYQLEDVEATGRTERHGPVSAVPVPGGTTGEPGDDGDPGTDPGDGDSSPPESSRVTYGDPPATSLRVLRRDATGVDLELLTGGFYATAEADGSTSLEIPGFESQGEPGTPAIPVERTFVDAVAGRQARITSVVPSEVLSFPWSRPALAGAPELLVSRDGTVRAGQRRVRQALLSRRPYPAQAARIVTTAFQGETKKALLELAPLRWNPSTGQLLLARRLRVRIAFAGTEPAETPLGGSRGRVAPGRGGRGARAALGLVAHLVASERGLYAVGFDDVFTSSRRPIPTSRLRLSRLGQDVPFHVEPDPSRFSPASTLYFLSDGGALSAYANEAVYELAIGTAGTPMPILSSPPAGVALTEAVGHPSWETNRYYMSGLLEAPDLWLWDSFVSGAPSKRFPFALSGLAASSEPAVLSVWLQGASDFESSPDHHVRLSVNGSFVAEGSWDGKTARRVEALLYPGLLHEGENSLEIENAADTPAAYSMVYLDRFSLEYPRALAAEAGRFEATFASAGSATVAGLGAASLVLDTTDGRPRWVVGSAAGPAGLTLATEPGHRYLAVSPQALRRPAIRWPSTGSDLRSAHNQADYLLIAPRELLPAAAPLLQLREEQGLKTRAVRLEEVYDAFGYGEKSPEAIRDFIAHAYHRWAPPSPRYVLLLGDATFDPKDYARTGVKDHLPVFLFKSTWLWTASDPAYASVNGEDGLPDLAIGRLPAASLEQAERLVHKLVAFERTGFDPSAPAVLVADNADKAGDFEADADDIASGPLASYPTEKIYLGRLGTAPTRSAILGAFDRGASLMSYVGHGGIDVWASERVLFSEDLPKLSPQARQPLLFTMNCLNGYFFAPAFDSLAEALVKAEDKGAIAAVSPSGLSLDSAAHLYHKALVAQIASGRHARLGDAILAAQSDYTDTGAFPELLRVYNLLGDPAMSLR